MNKWHLIQPLQREIYKKPMLISSGAKIFGHVSHSTELVRMCLACQHFDFNSADWISDNLHVIFSRYLRTMGKEVIFQFSRLSWGRNAWRTPKNVCLGGYVICCEMIYCWWIFIRSEQSLKPQKNEAALSLVCELGISSQDQFCLQMGVNLWR